MLSDVGWDNNSCIYEAYGMAGGSKAAKEFNEWLIDACREEMGGGEGLPHLLMADFNITPLNLETVKELVEDELWEDVGGKADSWGGVPNQPTCKTRAGAKATRIDGILANISAIPLIQSFKVENDEQAPRTRCWI